MPFFSRLKLAFVTFFRILFGKELPQQLPAPVSEKPASFAWLAALQREGRLIDFCEENLAGFSDAQVGAAARTVHDGCRKALQAMTALAPVRTEAEGASLEIPAGFDPRAVRLTGNVVGNPPFKGVLRHHGWRAGDEIVAPAEVELP